MPLYPGAKLKLIAPGTNDPAIKVIGAILHVDAGNSASLYNYFNGPSGGIESHFHVPKTNQVEQYRDTGREADANFKANSFLKDGVRYGFVSIETQGYEAGEWNVHQLAEIKKLLLWLSKTHGFPLRRCPGPFESGVGYHVMWGAPGPWTPVSKSCPGPARVKQYRDVIVPWMNTVTNPPKPPPAPPEEDMLSSDDIKKIWNADLIPHTTPDSAVTPEDPDNPNWRPLSTLAELDRAVRRIESKLDKLLAALADDGR